MTKSHSTRAYPDHATEPFSQTDRYLSSPAADSAGRGPGGRDFGEGRPWIESVAGNQEGARIGAHLGKHGLRTVYEATSMTRGLPSRIQTRIATGVIVLRLSAHPLILFRPVSSNPLHHNRVVRFDSLPEAVRRTVPVEHVHRDR